MLPACRACAYSAGKMPFVVEERGKENIVPVRLLSREALLYERRFRDRERAIVYLLAFAALFDT